MTDVIKVSGRSKPHDMYDIPLVPGSGSGQAQKQNGCRRHKHIRFCTLQWSEIIKISFCLVFVLAIFAAVFLLVYFIVFFHSPHQLKRGQRIIIEGFERTVDEERLTDTEREPKMSASYMLPNPTTSSSMIGNRRTLTSSYTSFVHSTKDHVPSTERLPAPRSDHLSSNGRTRTSNDDQIALSATKVQMSNAIRSATDPTELVININSYLKENMDDAPVSATYNVMMDPTTNPDNERVAVTQTRQPEVFDLDHKVIRRDANRKKAPANNGKCIQRRLRLCDPYLNYNMTVLPNIVGDKSLEEMETSLPYFGLVLKSKCNPRIKSYVCNLLEPKCGYDNKAVPPCKKFCNVAKEGCDALILQTLKLADVFKCRQYPDRNERKQCTNLARGRSCFSSEFQCPDTTCIPKSWVCDGIRDCSFAADEANCTTCTQNEFYCDMKCIPKSWRCDALPDCQDGMDEYNCPNKPTCTEDRYQCEDNSDCIPKRWMCDGRSDCRDASDEKDCDKLRGCQYGDFQCDSGICIPRSWRCDGQNDCKDTSIGSDEQNC